MLNFLYPWGLVSLASLGGILFLYFYVFRGRRIPVSALFLWQTSETFKREGQKRRRPPLTWPLILELLTALLMCLLIAGLVYARQDTSPHMVVLLDSSASMAAGGEDISFRDRAADRIMAIYARLGKDGKISIVETGFGGSVLGGRALKRGEAAALLAKWKPTAPPHSFRAALELARSLLAEDRQIPLITDRPVALEGVNTVAVGQGMANTGWVDANWRGQSELFAVAQHFGESEGTKEAVFYGDGQVLTRKELDFSERRAVPLAFEVPDGVSTVRAELPEDSLTADNTLRLTRPPREVLNVDVRLEEGALKERVLQALQAVRSVHVRQADPPALTFGFYSDQTTPPRDAFRVSFRVLGKGDAKAFVGPYFVLPYYDLTQGLELEGSVWAADPEFRMDGEVLASVGDVPLLVMRDRELVVNIRPEGTNLFRMPAWPVLISNVVDYVREHQPGLKRFSYRLSESLAFYRPRGWQGAVRVEAPDGETVEFDGEHIYYGRLKQDGVYTVHAGEQRVAALGVNLLAADESDLGKAASSGGLAELDVGQITRSDARPFHREFALAAAALLLGCWFLLERQKA